MSDRIMRARRATIRAWFGRLTLLAAFGLAGCGPLPPAKPVQDIKGVAGRWEGNLTYRSSEYGTQTGSVIWVIKEDGTYEMHTSKWRAEGTLRVDRGKVVFSDGPRASGIASLHEGPDGRFLVSTGDEPSTFGTFWPARAFKREVSEVERNSPQPASSKMGLWSAHRPRTESR